MRQTKKVHLSGNACVDAIWWDDGCWSPDVSFEYEDRERVISIFLSEKKARELIEVLTAAFGGESKRESERGTNKET